MLCHIEELRPKTFFLPFLQIYFLLEKSDDEKNFFQRLVARMD